MGSYIDRKEVQREKDSGLGWSPGFNGGSWTIGGYCKQADREHEGRSSSRESRGWGRGSELLVKWRRITNTASASSALPESASWAWAWAWVPPVCLSSLLRLFLLTWVDSSVFSQNKGHPYSILLAHIG